MTRLVLLRQSNAEKDEVDVALAESGAQIYRVNSTSDALTALSRDRTLVDAAVIESTNSEEVLQFLRILRNDSSSQNVPVILFRMRPTLIPRGMAVYEFMSKNRHLMDIDRCVTVSEHGVDELLRAIQSCVVRVTSKKKVNP